MLGKNIMCTSSGTARRPLRERNLQLPAVLAASLAVAAAGAHGYDGVCDSRAELAALPPGTWCMLANTQLQSAEKLPSDYGDFDGSSSPSFDSYQRVMGVDGVTRAWNSAAFDTRRNRLLVTGGGHNDYGGNEVYAFELQTLRWVRITDPTPFPNRHPESENDDGTPVSRHTYGGQLYLPSEDSLFLFGGAPDHGPGACGVSGAWQLSLEAVEENGYQPPDWRRLPADGEPSTACDDVAGVDRLRSRVIYGTVTGWFALDLSTETWTNLRQEPRTNRFTHTVIDPSRDLLVQVGGGETILRSLADPAFSRLSTPTTGDVDIQERQRPGLVFDPQSGYVIAWHGGAAVYALDPGSANWTRILADGQNLHDPGEVTTAGGAFSRFAYSPADDVFLYVDRVDENVVAYRLDRSGLDSRPVAPQLTIQQAP